MATQTNAAPAIPLDYVSNAAVDHGCYDLARLRLDHQETRLLRLVAVVGSQLAQCLFDQMAHK